MLKKENQRDCASNIWKLSVALCAPLIGGKFLWRQNPDGLNHALRVEKIFDGSWGGCRVRLGNCIVRQKNS